MGLFAVLVYLTVPPLLVLVYGSVTDTPPGVHPHFTLRVLREAYAPGPYLPALWNSVLYAAATATLVLLLSGLLAWLVERTDCSIRWAAEFFAVVPVIMPAVLLVSGWILLLGPRHGLLNMLSEQYLGFAPFNVYSFWGMVWVGMLQELPLGFLWLWPAFRSMNPDYEEAAIVAGASGGTVLWRITVPLLRPAVLGAWIIFFIYSLGALAVPLLIGVPARVFLYSTEIFLATARIPKDLNLASAYSLVFVLVTVFGIWAYRSSVAQIERFATVTGRAYRPRLVRLGLLQPVATAFGILILLLTAGLPLFVLVWNAFMPYPQVPTLESLRLATAKNFAAALDYGPAKRAVLNSLLLGVGAGLVATVLGVLIAWCSVRLKRQRLIEMLDQLAMAPIAIPGMIFGVSLLWLYLVLPIPVYGTLWILLIAYVTLHLPFAVRICMSGLAQLHRELEEAGQVCGAGWLTVFRRIVLPLAASSLLASGLYVMLRSFREYAASIFLAGPGREVFSVLVLDMAEGGNLNILSAFVTMVMGLLSLAVLLTYWIGRRSGVRL
jgi:iron(III) transport system permease protein